MEKILLAIAVFVVIGFFWQFGILKSIWDFFGTRKKQALKDFKNRCNDLDEKKKVVEDLRKLVDLSDEEIFKADAAINQEKGALAKKVVAANASNKKAKEEINNMSIVNLLEKVEKIEEEGLI